MHLRIDFCGVRSRMPMDLIYSDAVDVELNRVVEACSQDPAGALEQASRLKVEVREVEMDDGPGKLD